MNWPFAIKPLEPQIFKAETAAATTALLQGLGILFGWDREVVAAFTIVATYLVAYVTVKPE